MAVFADRIILKSSSDSEAAISAAIAPGSSDEIVPGEIVIGITPGTARLYTLDANNQVVTLGGTAATQLAGLIDVDVTTNPPSNNQSLAYDAANGVWVPSTPVVGASQLNELSDVDLGTVAPGAGDSLVYDSLQAQFVVGKPAYSIDELSDVDVSSFDHVPQDGESLIWNQNMGHWMPGTPDIVGLASVSADPAPALGGNLDPAGFSIQPQAGGEVLMQFDGGQLRIEDDVPTIAFQRIGESSPHLYLTSGQSASSYTLQLPGDAGTNGYVLGTNGAGATSWVSKDLRADTTPELGGSLDLRGLSVYSSEDGLPIRFAAADNSGEVHIETGHSATRPGLKIFAQGNRAGTDAGTIIRSQASAEWTLDLPASGGTSGQVLTTDGTGLTSWEDGPAADLSVNTLGDIGDVSISGAPAFNEALVWNGNAWVPGSVSADISSTSINALADVTISSPIQGQVLAYVGGRWENSEFSVNGQTGVVSIGVEDLDDFALDRIQATVFQFDNGVATSTGEWELDGANNIDLNNNDRTAQSFLNYMLAFAGNAPSSFFVSSTGEDGSWTEMSVVSVVNQGAYWSLSSLEAMPITSGDLYLTWTTPPQDVLAAEGDVLTYDAGLQKYVPRASASGISSWNDLQDKPTLVENLGDLDDVDLSTNAPINGQVIEYDAASGTWKPGDGTGAVSVISVNGLSGAVELGIQDMGDYALRGSQGALYNFNQNIGETGAAYTDPGTWGPANQGADLLLSGQDSYGEDMATVFAGLPSTGQVWLKRNVDANWQGPATYTAITSNYLGSGAYGLEGVGSFVTSTANTDLQVTFVDPTQTAQSLANGDVLTWNDAYRRFEPTPTAATVVSIDDLSDVDTSTVAPTAGQLLAYDGTTSQWGPVDAPQNAPVDSVNGQTGVVSLGIQDMDDYQPEYLNFTFLEFERGHPTSGVGIWSQGGTKGSSAKQTDLNGNNWDNYFQDFTDGDTVWYSTDNGQTWSSTTAIRHTLIYDDTTGLISTDLYYTVYGMSAGDRIRFALFDPYALTPAPLNDGEALVWDGDAQKFRPTGLATVATSGSYNDLTDQPTIANRIQDQTDFALNLVSVPGNTYSSSTQITDTGAAGYARYATNFSSPQPFIINEVISDGTNLNAGLSALSAGDSFWWSFDGGLTTEEFTIDSINQGVNGRWDLTPTSPPSGSWTSSNDDPFERGQDWVLYLGDPGGTVEDPLADGDYLRWDAADSKFKPAQFGTGLTIQGMDDFALESSAQTLSWGAYSDLTVESHLNDGEWYAGNTSSYLLVSIVDATGDQTSLLTALAGEEVTVTDSQGGVFVFTPTSSNQDVTGVGARVYLGGFGTTNSAAIDKTGGITISSASFGTVEIGLADNDTLKWDATDSKFKPGRTSYNELTDTPAFATVATSGDYNDLINTPVPSVYDGVDGGTFGSG